MFQLKTTRRTLILSALSFLFIVTACAAQTYPIVRGETTTELVFAPDGQTLWSEEWSGQLVIRSSDGQTEKYRGSLPSRFGGEMLLHKDGSLRYRGDAPDHDGGELRVLKDGSFLRATNAGAVKWFDPPQMGQPLRVRRELAPPPAMDWEADDYQPAKFEGAPQGTRVYRTQFSQQPSGRPGQAPRGTKLRSAGALAISPDEARVAVSLIVRLWDDQRESLGNEPGRQEITRVWNLQTGAIEMERKVLLPGLRDGKVEAGEFPYDPACLGWADAQTLVVARGLSLTRFDATTGRQISAWQPANAQREFVTAKLKRLRKRQSISPIEVNEFIKFAQPRPFDVESQQLMALSDDGSQLLLLQWSNLWSKPLLTWWDSATGEAQILSEDRGMTPLKGRISSDGTKVAVWDNWDVWSWRRENRSSPFAPSLSQVTIPTAKGGGFGKPVSPATTPQTKLGPVRIVALTGDRIAWARDYGTPFVLRFMLKADLGRRPVRLEDLRTVETQTPLSK